VYLYTVSLKLYAAKRVPSKKQLSVDKLMPYRQWNGGLTNRPDTQEWSEEQQQKNSVGL